VDDPRFATSEARVRHRADLDRLLGEVFAAHPVAHWDAALRAHRVPAGPPATVGEAVEKARRRGQVVDLPAVAYGILPTIAAPFLFDGERAAPTSSAPALGEHTEAVLREVGVSEEEIQEILKTPG
jgi:crotonobetainyl-CoA:carnitine CoA-transferase CaiB-like acyl-CoA transferase